MRHHSKHAPGDVGFGSRLDVELLWSGRHVELAQTAWRRGDHPESSEIATPYVAIELMHRGSFLRTHAGDVHAADPTCAVIFQPGEPFRIEHPYGAHNSGLTIRVRDRALLERAPGGHRGPAHGEAQRSRASIPRVVPVHPSVRLELVRALRSTRGGPRAAQRIEPRLLDIAARIYHAAPATGPLDRGENDDRGDDAAEFAQLLCYMNERFADPLSLAGLSAAAGCSQWCLLRRFRRYLGVSPLRHLLRLRLHYAFADLADGAAGITDVAMRCGFSSHSHLTAAFRREFGFVPSALRDANVHRADS